MCQLLASVSSVSSCVARLPSSPWFVEKPRGSIEREKKKQPSLKNCNLKVSLNVPVTLIKKSNFKNYGQEGTIPHPSPAGSCVSALLMLSGWVQRGHRSLTCMSARSGLPLAFHGRSGYPLRVVSLLLEGYSPSSSVGRYDQMWPFLARDSCELRVSLTEKSGLIHREVRNEGRVWTKRRDVDGQPLLFVFGCCFGLVVVLDMHTEVLFFWVWGGFLVWWGVFWFFLVRNPCIEVIWAVWLILSVPMGQLQYLKSLNYKGFLGSGCT